MEEAQFVRRKIPTGGISPMVKSKWPEEVLDEGFVPFPKRLMRSMNVLFPGKDGVERLAVILTIIDYERPNLTRGASIDFLAFTSGLSRERFERRLSELENEGMVVRGGHDDAMRFDLTNFFEAIKELTKD